MKTIRMLGSFLPQTQSPEKTVRQEPELSGICGETSVSDSCLKRDLRPFFCDWAVSLSVTWCNKGALMTTHIPQLPSCNRMEASWHVSGVAQWNQLVGSLIWLSCNTVPSRFLGVLPYVVISRLGIICTLTRFDATLFRDLDNFRGQPLVTHYGCLRKGTLQWMRHDARMQKLETAAAATKMRFLF